MSRLVVRTLQTAVFGVLVAFCGCSSNPKYVEGTTTSIGAYLPIDGNLYGAEIVSYLAGAKVQCSTNQTMHVERTHSASNSYFGIVHTVESSDTKVSIGK